VVLQALMGIPALVPAYVAQRAEQHASNARRNGTGRTARRCGACRSTSRGGATVRAAAILALLFLAGCGDGWRATEFYFYDFGGVHVVGPFASEDECQKIRREIRVGSSTSCWRGR
jgi:hypothetical protein